MQTPKPITTCTDFIIEDRRFLGTSRILYLQKDLVGVNKVEFYTTPIGDEATIFESYNIAYMYLTDYLYNYKAGYESTLAALATGDFVIRPLKVIE